MNPAGASKTGSTGVQFKAVLNGITTAKTYTQAFTAIRVFGYGGNDYVQLAGSLTIGAAVSGPTATTPCSLAAATIASRSATATTTS